MVYNWRKINMKIIKGKSIMMVILVLTAIFFASCNKENDNQTQTQLQPQTLSEMIVGKWKCTEANHRQRGNSSHFKDPTANVGTIWNFKDDGTLVLPDGVESYNIIEGEKLQLQISNYGQSEYSDTDSKYFDMTLTNNELSLYRRQENANYEYYRVFDAKFTKIQ